MLRKESLQNPKKRTSNCLYDQLGGYTIHINYYNVDPFYKYAVSAVSATAATTTVSMSIHLFSA